MGTPNYVALNLMIANQKCIVFNTIILRNCNYLQLFAIIRRNDSVSGFTNMIFH